ncbi:MAG: YHS domain-containing protein [Nitrospirae bacterium]|nr:YHS domain-containing protein [Nitrospirota bacterium]
MKGGEWTSGNSQKKADTALDPVCGMSVSLDKAAATSKYKDMTYYFCSVKCRERFDKEPEKYLQDSGADRHNHP